MYQFSPSSALLPQRYVATQVVAAVIWTLFPNVILKGGGLTSIGFYYDFILEQPLTESMVELVEVHLHRFLKEEHPLRFISMMRENAQSLFEHHHHPLLAQQIGLEASNIVDLIQIEDFHGLCPPCSFSSVEEVGHVKILGFEEIKENFDEEEVIVTRLVGTTQNSAKDLKSFVKCYDQYLKKRDHRTLGPLLNLFTIENPAESLGVTWHSKGMKLQHLLQEILMKQLPEEVQQISTPIMVKQRNSKSFSIQENSFSFENYFYQVRSSPLKQHIKYLKTKILNSKNFPCHLLEWTTIYQQLFDSQQWGLLVSPTYLSDQMTICCEKSQVIQELISSLHFIEQIITMFDFEAQWYLIASRHKSPKARLEKEAIDWLRQAISVHPKVFAFSPEIQEEEEIKGPRLELKIRDKIGREWPISTLEIVLFTNETKLLVIDESHSSNLVVMARQVWSSLDRFIALLIEHHEGRLPLGLAPEQIRILAIGEANHEYARHISQSLQQKGWRVSLDKSQAKLSVRIHEAEKENVPYLILLGEQERIKQKINVRLTGKVNHSEFFDLETFFNKLNQECLWPIPKKVKAAMLTGESKSA